eukprot:scaffold544_cov117-Isochrysis_galbana.AAC.28
MPAPRRYASARSAVKGLRVTSHPFTAPTARRAREPRLPRDPARQGAHGLTPCELGTNPSEEGQSGTGLACMPVLKVSRDRRGPPGRFTQKRKAAARMPLTPTPRQKSNPAFTVHGVRTEHQPARQASPLSPTRPGLGELRDRLRVWPQAPKAPAPPHEPLKRGPAPQADRPGPQLQAHVDSPASGAHTPLCEGAPHHGKRTIRSECEPMLLARGPAGSDGRFRMPRLGLIEHGLSPPLVEGRPWTGNELHRLGVVSAPLPPSTALRDGLPHQPRSAPAIFLLVGTRLHTALSRGLPLPRRPSDALLRRQQHS